jgi:hypothetical protein
LGRRRPGREGTRAERGRVNMTKVHCIQICKCYNDTHYFAQLIYDIKRRKPGHQWLTPVILATQEAEIRRFVVQKLAPGNTLQDPSSKITKTQKGWCSGSRYRP